MAITRSLVSPTTNPLLEKALREKLYRRSEAGGNLGELEPLAIRLGLMQNTLKPRFHDPQLLMFAADHGLAVDGVSDERRSTQDTVRMLLGSQLPVSVFARAQQIGLTVIDCGMAEDLAPGGRLQVRKIAHGTRNTRVSAAMSVEQARASIRAGIEIGEKLPGNATILAGVGVGSHESAALVLASLTDTSVSELVISGPDMDRDVLARCMTTLNAARARHRDVADPVEVLAVYGGFEVAVMVGVMLSVASRRHLLMIDGLPACAALMVAACIAQPVTDYCVFCRSHSHLGLDQALNLFHASSLLEMGLESTDGTGATLAWPMVSGAAALLTEVAEGEDPGPTLPGGLGAPPAPADAEATLPVDPLV